MIGAGSADSESDFDVYLLLDDSISKGDALVDLPALEACVRTALHTIGVDKPQPFILPRNEFLKGRRASINGTRSIDEAITEELRDPLAVIASEVEVLDDPDYTLVKAAWSFVTARHLAGEDCTKEIEEGYYDFEVTKGGVDSWLKLSYLMSLVYEKTFRSNKSKLAMKLSKCIIRMAFSRLVDEIRLKDGVKNLNGETVITATKDPNIIGVLKSDILAKQPMDARYIYAINKFGKLYGWGDEATWRILQFANKYRNSTNIISDTAMIQDLQEEVLRLFQM